MQGRHVLDSRFRPHRPAQINRRVALATPTGNAVGEYLTTGPDDLEQSIDRILSIYAGLVDFCGGCWKSVGGRERESNPPETVSRPQPVLKTGRPTGDAALPVSPVILPETRKRTYCITAILMMR